MPTLDWIGKKAVIRHHAEVPFHLLKEEGALSCGGEAGAGNLIVQGDNLKALKALLPHYAGKVKCIYIDPPYNTGNEGWVYNDNVNAPEIKKWLASVVGKEGEDLSRHDKWLCMMYPRLVVLKEFLTEDGVIFISIDDNEAAYLSLLLDEIFGRRNFVVNMIWQKMDSPSSNYGPRAFSNYHDHTLVYARSIDRAVIKPRTKNDILDAYPDQDDEGKKCRLRQLRKNGKSARREDRPSMWYRVTDPDGNEMWPIHPQEKWEGRWTIGEATYHKLAASGGLRWKKRPYGWMAYTVEYPPDIPTIPNPSILTDAGQNRQAKAVLNEILGTDHGFDTPKPVGLIERILQIASDKDSLILDSFAGSGTTGHAILKQNAEDGGNRRFILVEMEEKIAQNITAERVRRVSQGYTNAKGEAVPGLGGGFRFATLGKTLFDETGAIREDVKFRELAEFVYFHETGSPLPAGSRKSPLLGTVDGRAIYLLYNGILADKTPDGGNVLTAPLLAELPPHKGPKVIYAAACRLGPARLDRERIQFKQTPYALRVE